MSVKFNTVLLSVAEHIRPLSALVAKVIYRGTCGLSIVTYGQ